MSSLKYEITQIPISPVKIKNKKSTIMTQTVKEYRNDAIHFGEWCKKNRGIRHLTGIRIGNEPAPVLVPLYWLFSASAENYQLPVS